MGEYTSSVMDIPVCKTRVVRSHNRLLALCKTSREMTYSSHLYM